MNTTKEKFGERVEETMHWYLYSTDTLASTIGVPKEEMEAILQGKCRPDEQAMKKLAQALHTSQALLLRGDGKKDTEVKDALACVLWNLSILTDEERDRLSRYLDDVLDEEKKEREAFEK